MREAFDTLDEVYEYYNDQVVKIVNLKQILFYAHNCGIQPDFIAKSIFDDRLIAYYGKEKTRDAFAYWKSIYPR